MTPSRSRVAKPEVCRGVTFHLRKLDIPGASQCQEKKKRLTSATITGAATQVSGMGRIPSVTQVTRRLVKEALVYDLWKPDISIAPLNFFRKFNPVFSRECEQGVQRSFRVYGVGRKAFITAQQHPELQRAVYNVGRCSLAGCFFADEWYPGCQPRQDSPQERVSRSSKIAVAPEFL